MANALSWIVREAKSLRRKYPHRYDKLANPWRDGYVAQASAIYAKKHKGKSPVGKKKHRPHRLKISRSRVKKKVRRVSSVTTRSKSHVDKNRITANIQVGGTSQHNSYLITRLQQRNNELAALEVGIKRLRDKARMDRGDKYMNKARHEQLRNYANYKRELKREITSLKRLIK